MFSKRIDNGGGEGWKSSLPGSRRDDNGIGSAITDPKNAMLAIHFVDKRGSKVNAVAGQ